MNRIGLWLSGSLLVSTVGSGIAQDLKMEIIPLRHRLTEIAAC